jgi:iron complex outermembrane recepter protein
LFNGGRINVAVGGDVRWESYANKRAAYDGQNPPDEVDPPWLRADDNDIINNSPNAPIDASQTIYSIYSEVAFPFITRENRRPLVDALELTLAGRFEHFSIHGQTTKPKASLVWKPASWLKLRSSYNESFRAPNLAQTSVTPTRRQLSTTDYYRQGVTGLAEDGAILRLNLIQGNQDLKPEEAESWVAGFVVDVPKVRGLSLMFDYWRIKQTNAFASFGSAATLRQDELYLDLATQQALAAGTPADQIDLGSGTTNYKGYQVERRPVTAEDRALFAAYNARQATNATRRAPVGEYLSATNGLINLGSRDLEGYDLGFQYRLPKSRLGQFTLKGEATHYLRREDQVDDASPVLSSLRTDGSASWRANLGASLRRGAWSAGWFSNYYGSYVDTSAATTKPVWDALGNPDYISEFYDNGVVRYLLRVDPVIVHNVSLSYRFGATARPLLRGVSIRGGVNNVWDEEPSLSDEVHGYQGGAVNPRGRQFTLDLSKSF